MFDVDPTAFPVWRSARLARSAWRAVLGGPVRSYSRHRQYLDLAELDAHLLRDLGISPEAARRARRWFR